MHFVKKLMWRWITSAQLAFGSRAQATIVLFIGSETQESKIEYKNKQNKTKFICKTLLLTENKRMTMENIRIILNV